MRKKKLFLAAAFLCFVLAAAAAFYWYRKPRDNMANVKTDFAISAKDLYAAYQQDENKANQQYLDKVLSVSGPIDNVQATDSTINCLLAADNDMGGINCSILRTNKAQPLPAKGNVVTIKGKCIGYLVDVNLADAVFEH